MLAGVPRQQCTGISAISQSFGPPFGGTLRLQSDTGFILDLARQCAASGKRNPTETMGATGEYRGSIGSRPFAHGPFESGLLELAMPLRHTRHACFATEPVVANYG